MIALLSVGAEKASDENLAESADHAKADWLGQNGPEEMGASWAIGF
jgi:hypothetical protein